MRDYWYVSASLVSYPIKSKIWAFNLGSGKTEIIRQLVDNASQYYDSDGQELSILYCYKSECVDFCTEVMTCQSLPPVVELDAFAEQSGMKWLILDDLIDEFQGNVLVL